MANVYVIGTHTTRFQRWPDRDHKDLVREVVAGALSDAGGDLGPRVQSQWFGTCAMHLWGQTNIGGAVCLSPLVEEGMLAAHAPTFGVEGGCATGSMAVHGAWKDIASGSVGLSLAVGVDKTFLPEDPVGMMGLFAGGLDQLDPDIWGRFYADAAAQAGLSWRPHPARITLLDICALQAEHHMGVHGTTREQIGASAAKNHSHGALNSRAQYQKAMTVDEVLADKPVVGPLTRAMCAPIGDGAAAALLCGEGLLQELPPEVQERAVRLSACAMVSGTWRSLGEPSPARVAADRAYGLAGLSPEDVDVAEVHDATSFAEIHLSEMLRFCPAGEGGAYVASGAATLGGRRPANTSGGLVSKGHPLGATGVAMVHELVTQLRGEAGDRQVEGAQVALQENGGGMIGFDEAVTSVMLLERRQA